MSDTTTGPQGQRDVIAWELIWAPDGSTIGFVKDPEPYQDDPDYTLVPLVRALTQKEPTPPSAGLLEMLDEARDFVPHTRYSESVAVPGVGFETNVYCHPDCLRCRLDALLAQVEE